MDRVEEGKVISETVVVGHIRKHDNKVLIRWAEACLEEFSKGKDGTQININNSATANALASTNVTISPDKLADLQARQKRQLEKQAAREERLQTAQTETQEA